MRRRRIDCVADNYSQLRIPQQYAPRRLTTAEGMPGRIISRYRPRSWQKFDVRCPRSKPGRRRRLVCLRRIKAIRRGLRIIEHEVGRYLQLRNIRQWPLQAWILQRERIRQSSRRMEF